MDKTNEMITIPKIEYEALKSENAAQKVQIAELTQKVEWLMEQFKLSRHRQFAPSTEKSEYDQLSVFNEAEKFSDISVPEPELIEVAKHYRKRTRLIKDKLPDDIPVEAVKHELPESERVCPACGGAMHRMGCDARRELVIIPASVKIREHVRDVYACRHCQDTDIETPIIKAEMPEPVIKGGFASPEAISHIAAQKFVMGSPLYRQEKEWAMQGIELSRQTMSNWLVKAAEDWLKPIYCFLVTLLLSHDVLHADETTLQVLHEDGKTAQSKSYIWLYRTSGDVKHPIVLYEYQPDRQHKHPAEFLKEFKGYLHSDGYEAYHKIAGVISVGCFGHIRRKFDEALKILPEKSRADSLALKGKRYCDALFALERNFAALTPAERFQQRAEKSKPIIDEFFDLCAHGGALPKTATGVAIAYALSQRKYLENYLLDGRLEISNNRAERSIKPFVIDRKNFLFANTIRGAESSTIIFSLIETAKENGLNPYAYLTYVFANAPNMDLSDNDVISRLLPWNIALSPPL